MNEVVENLYISERIVAENLPEDEYKVLMISLYPLRREHVQVEIEDCVPWPCETVELIINTISSWLAEGETVCVACDAGISRSASAIMAYLMSRGMSVDEATDIIKSKRGITRPHPLIVESIVKCLSQKKD